MVFKRMYANPLELKKPIDEVVDSMPSNKLDWAMTQVQNTLKVHLKDNSSIDIKPGCRATFKNGYWDCDCEFKHPIPCAQNYNAQNPSTLSE